MKKTCDCKWFTRCKKLQNCKKPVVSWPVSERKLSANDSPELDTAMAVMLMQTSSVETTRPAIIKTWEPQQWSEKAPADSCRPTEEPSRHERCDPVPTHAPAPSQSYYSPPSDSYSGSSSYDSSSYSSDSSSSYSTD